MTLSKTKALKMKCKRCMADFTDGRTDCEIKWCPLYPWMPYRKLEPDLSWVDEPFARRLSAKTKQILTDRMKEYHRTKKLVED